MIVRRRIVSKKNNNIYTKKFKVGYVFKIKKNKYKFHSNKKLNTFRYNYLNMNRIKIKEILVKFRFLERIFNLSLFRNNSVYIKTYYKKKNIIHYKFFFFKLIKYFILKIKYFIKNIIYKLFKFIQYFFFKFYLYSN
jgi:hypothetical protein